MLKLFSASFKILVRDRPFIFWSFMGPLLVTLMFGYFFNSGGASVGGTVSGPNLGKIGLVDRSGTPVGEGLAKVFSGIDGLRVSHPRSLRNAREEMSKGKLSAVVVIPQGFGSGEAGSPTKVTVIDDPGSPQTGAIVGGIVERCVGGLDYFMRGMKPVYSVEHQSAARRAINYFDWVLIGLVALGVMHSSLVGIAIGVASYRQDKILKRIMTTPLPQWRFIVAQVLSRLILNIVQIAFTLAVGIVVFHASVYGSIPVLCAFAMLGAVVFQLIGFTIATISRTVQSAEGMATAVFVPLQLLSGVFIPTEGLPSWLGSIMHYLPLAPLLNIMRGVALQAESPIKDPENLIILSSWILGLFIFTCWKFRMADE